MGSKGRGYPAGITGPVREPAPTKPEVVGIGQDRQIPHVASIYVGESAVFPIIFYPADYVSAISDYSCTTPGVNLSLEPDLDNYLRVEFTEQVQPDTNIPIYFKNQLIMNVTSVEQIPEVTEVLKKVGDDWIPVTEVAIAVDEGEDIWVKFSNPDYKPKASQFSFSPLTDDVSISVITDETVDEGAFVSIEVFGEQAYGTSIYYKDQLVVGISAPATEFVDLGLPSGRLWANKNLGAVSPTDAGDYYMWGETEGHAKGSGYDFSLASYNAQGLNLINSNLNLVQDAAHVQLGGDCRMPTISEFEELYNNTDVTWTTINGVNGRKFANKTDASKYIFMPAAGIFTGSSLLQLGSYGGYWASTFLNSNGSYRLGFNSQGQYSESNYRYYGNSVRAVK